jgi:hypothetical protein
VVSVGGKGVAVKVGRGWVAVTVGASRVAVPLAVIDGKSTVAVGEAAARVAVGVPVCVLTAEVLVKTFGTLMGFPEAIKVEFPKQLARCKSATVTR